MEYTNKNVTSNYRKTGTISESFRKTEQYTGKARDQGTTEKSNTGHCTRTSEIINVKIQKVITGNNITYATHYNHSKSTTLHILETWFVSCM